MSVNDDQEPGCGERGIDQLPTLEIALFSLYLITSQRDTPHSFLVLAKKKKLKL